MNAITVDYANKEVNDKTRKWAERQVNMSLFSLLNSVKPMGHQSTAYKSDEHMNDMGFMEQAYSLIAWRTANQYCVLANDRKYVWEFVVVF